MEPSRPTRGVASRPIGDPPADWRVYWRSNGQSWRTEPEISASRKRALRLRLDIARERDDYPFKGIEPRLSRADVEWLLAGHNNGRGPVNVYDPEDDGRWGLDLRGADLRGADLRGLPLARMRGGLPESEWRFAEHGRLEAAAVHLEGAHLEHAHLEGAELPGAHCEGAILDEVNLEAANLSQACLDDASLRRARLGGAFLGGARLARAELDSARLPGAFLVGARLEGAHLANARLETCPR